MYRFYGNTALIEEQYEAAALTPLTTNHLWAYFNNASSRIDMVCTRITNSDMVARLVSLANKGVEINIVTEQGFFGNSDSAAKWVMFIFYPGNDLL